MQLWRALEVMLCARRDKADVSYIRTLVPAEVKISAASTGDVCRSKRIARSPALIDQLFSRRKAWAANVDVHGEKATLQFFANEACVSSRTFILIECKWYLAKIGQECD